MAMNIFFLAPILGCVSEIVRGEMSEPVRAHEIESHPAGSQNLKREKAFEGADYIGNYVT